MKPEPLPLSSLPLPLCPGQSTHLGPSLSQALLEHQWDLPEAAGAAEEPARPRREAVRVLNMVILNKTDETACVHAE